MNFFHFDGAEMTLRHITLAGVRVKQISRGFKPTLFADNGMATLL
jgi:hypothetical protein